MQPRVDDNTFAMILDNINSDTIHVDAHKVDPTIEKDWQMDHSEGKLAVDVGYTDTHVFVVSPMAGVGVDTVEVHIHNDLLTIRGSRKNPLAEQKEIDYYYQECFWGIFSRSVVLPVEVKAELSQATYRNGVLEIRIPKRKTDTKIPIEIIEE